MRLSLKQAIQRVGMGALLSGAAACGDVVGTAPLPPGTQSPSSYNTTAGALEMARGTRFAMVNALVSSIKASGTFTDEFESSGLSNSALAIGGIGDPVDERIVPEQLVLSASVSSDKRGYFDLQGVRNSALQAVGLLAKYAPAVSPAVRGEMYALRGYAELLLADQYCSGIPLSTFDFEQDFTYQPGSTTSQVYRHAIALFDTALAISSDSAVVMDLARVGRGRAFLDLGQYDSAAATVASVSSTFSYSLDRTWQSGVFYEFASLTVADSEGQNGLAYVSSPDPRTPVLTAGVNQFGVTQYQPVQYRPGTTAPIVLASATEARLIRAEVALHGSTPSASIDTLNALRATIGLAALTDPGSDSARVSQVFAERGFWLFLTAHRQGDIRRLVRNYGRAQNTVYPTGAYFGGLGVYGTDVTLPIPPDERTNPLFTGCLNRDA